MYRLRELVHLKFGGEDVPDADLKQSADLAQAALSRLDQALQSHTPNGAWRKSGPRAAQAAV